MNINTEQVFLVNSADLNPESLHTATPLQRSFAISGVAVYPDAPSSSSLCLPQSLDPPPRTQMCRLCATVTDLVVPIFEGEGLQNGLADKIHQHLPIKVSEQDVLPVVLCFQCTSTVLAWHELVVCCVQADAAMRERFHQPPDTLQPLQHIAHPSSQTEIKHEKSQLKLFKNIKTTIKEYLHSIDMDDQVVIVCQKCDNKHRFTTDEFTDHLASNHDLVKFDEDDIVAFIRDNVTFEEALVFDQQSNESMESDLKQLNELETLKYKDIDNLNAQHDKSVLLDESEIQFVEEQDMDVIGVLDDTETKHTHDRVHLPTLLCPYCDSAFSSTTRLIYHLGTHMEISIDNGVQCCEVTYNTKRDYVTHLQEKHVNRLIYDPDSMCKSCSFRAETCEELKAHIQMFHKEKTNPRKSLKESAINQKFIPAVCPECNEVYSNKYNMMNHLKLHLRPEKFKCDRCDKEYSTKGNLAQHVRLAHEGKLPHACGLCGERFPTRGARDIHSRIHTGEKPFQCGICNVSFRANNTLLRHLDIHRGVRNHQCALCDKRFNKWSQLTAHARVHYK